MNGINDGANMGLLHFFMKEQAAAALNPRIALRSRSLHERQKGITLTPHSEVVNYLLGMYATFEVITKIDAKVMRFIQPLSRTLIEYAELLWAKMLHRNRVYYKYILKGSFIESVQDSIH